MTSKFPYLPKDQRKNILLLADDIRMFSGVATQAREIVLKSAHHFNWLNLGAAVKHPEIGKVLDLSKEVNKMRGIDDADVKVIPNNGYGSIQQVRQLQDQYKIDAIFIFTDPRYFEWLFNEEREIRSQIPIFYLNIWDDYPAPNFNYNYYRSVDLLMGISKQTVNINKLVLGEEANDKVIRYVPHGIDSNVFKPIEKDTDAYLELMKTKIDMFRGDEPEFVVLFNSRNIHRKHASDTMLAYKIFCDMIGDEAAKKCALVMKTEVNSDHGTDLRAVKEALTDPEVNRIYFNQGRLAPEQMNQLYNIADVNILLTSNEGFGLSLAEANMAGTMIIANTTGGMQDQMRFVDDKGEWYTPSADIPSNHRGTYKKHGEWSLPVYPSNISLAGSPKTPYIFDDRCNPEDAAARILEAYELGKEERDRRGAKAREWVMGDESKMEATTMVDNVIDSMTEAFDKFTPRPRYEFFITRPHKSPKVTHKLYGY
jgi:glycosyltransferase involved in cell wall biosynthesis